MVCLWMFLIFAKFIIERYIVMSEKIVAGNLDEVISRGDHGDRSGGLLIGYVGLITVPVAYNCYAKGARSCKSGYGVFCMGKFF